MSSMGGVWIFSGIVHYYNSTELSKMALLTLFLAIKIMVKFGVHIESDKLFSKSPKNYNMDVTAKFVPHLFFLYIHCPFVKISNSLCRDQFG